MAFRLLTTLTTLNKTSKLRKCIRFSYFEHVATITCSKPQSMAQAKTLLEPDDNPNSVKSVKINSLQHSPSSEEKSHLKSVHVEYGEAVFDIVYEDHFINSNPAETHPIIVGVHGDLGSASDFSYIVPGLTKAGYRLLLVNFPGFGISSQISPEEPSYQGPVERSQLLSAFLDKLNVERVDMLLSHSAGAWVSYDVAKNDLRIQSLTLICPVAHRRHRALWLQRIIPIGVWLLSSRFRSKLEYVFNLLYSYSGMNPPSMEKMDASLNFFVKVNFSKCREAMDELKERNLPTLVAFSKCDKIIEWQIAYEACQIIGIPSSHVLVYDKDGLPVAPEMEYIDPIVDGSFKRGLMFETGSHYLHKLHSERIVDNMTEMMNHIKDKKQDKGSKTRQKTLN